MKIIIQFLLVMIVSQNLVFAQEPTVNDIKVVIKNLENDKGKIHISLFDSENRFLEESLKTDRLTISNKSCEYTFKNIPPGVYAVSFYHDENDNNKMDTNFLGIPKEDYGCSNNARGTMGPPKWEDAKFELKNKTITQTITL